jgi:hypothetical protein
MLLIPARRRSLGGREDRHTSARAGTASRHIIGKASFPSLAILRRRLEEVRQFTIKLHSVEWNNDHFTAMIVVCEFLILGHIQDRERKVSHMAIVQ